MPTLTARCGLNCAECEAYLATQKHDPAELEILVKKWGEMFHKDITVKDVLCDGCTTLSDRHCSYCYECGVRKCAEERQLANCAVCSDYGCATLTAFWAFAAKSKENLEAIRA